MSAAPTTERGRSSRDWALGLWWVLASAAGMGLAYVVVFAHFILALELAPMDRSTAVDFVVPIALLLCIPLFQWLVLRRRIPRSGYWFLATDAGLIASAVLLGLVNRAFPGRTMPIINYLQPFSGPVTLIIVGLCLGFAQWAVLRRHLRMPGLWVVASVLGWASTVAVVVEGRLGYALVWIAMGLMTGICTGLALVLLWKQPEKRAAAIVGR